MERIVVVARCDHRSTAMDAAGDTVWTLAGMARVAARSHRSATQADCGCVPATYVVRAGGVEERITRSDESPLAVVR